MTTKTEATTPGVCRACGCTDEVACEGGCCWVDERRDLCSACDEGFEVERQTIPMDDNSDIDPDDYLPPVA